MIRGVLWLNSFFRNDPHMCDLFKGQYLKLSSSDHSNELFTIGFLADRTNPKVFPLQPLNVNPSLSCKRSFYCSGGTGGSDIHRCNPIFIGWIAPSNNIEKQFAQSSCDGTNFPISNRNVVNFCHRSDLHSRTREENFFAN